MLDEAVKRTRDDWTPNPHGLGGKGHKAVEDVVSVDNIHTNNPTRPTGTSKQADLRRLAKDRPDLIERVKAGELSVTPPLPGK